MFGRGPGLWAVYAYIELRRPWCSWPVRPDLPVIRRASKVLDGRGHDRVRARVGADWRDPDLPESLVREVVGAGGAG